MTRTSLYWDNKTDPPVAAVNVVIDDEIDGRRKKGNLGSILPVGI